MNTDEPLCFGQLSKSIHVLIVEDKPDNAQIAEAFIETFGAKSTTVANGAEALEHCQKETFDAILMDLSMPILNGFDTTDRLKHTETPNRHTPVVALTAHVSPEIREKCLKYGMTAYLEKPIDPVLLFQVMNDIAISERVA
jgi:CheY-like chemotaxis protein